MAKKLKHFKLVCHALRAHWIKFPDLNSKTLKAETFLNIKIQLPD